MKLPMLPIHYKPKYLISRIRENYGDSVLKTSLRGIVVNVPEGVEPCFAVNICKLYGPFFRETGDTFYGIRNGEYIEPTKGICHGK